MIRCPDGGSDRVPAITATMGDIGEGLGLPVGSGPVVVTVDIRLGQVFPFLRFPCLRYSRPVALWMPKKAFPKGGRNYVPKAVRAVIEKEERAKREARRLQQDGSVKKPTTKITTSPMPHA